MGEVYRATDGKLGRDVAIKVLPAELAQDSVDVGDARVVEGGQQLRLALETREPFVALNWQAAIKR